MASTAGNIFRKLLSEITLSDRKEAESIAFILMEHFFQARRIDVLSDRILPQDGYLPEGTIEQINQNVPVQYVIGQTEFYGRDFFVNEHVLIPRPETEELVQMIVNENRGRGNIKIWDIGTGSGCIAVSLKSELPDAEVFASDISKEALAMAQKNAEHHNAKVVFVHHDIFEPNTVPDKVDVIVSNPPYVTESEKVLMHDNVLEHEPSGALFVADSDPLVYYKRISEIGLEKLEKGGRLYFEINEMFGKQMKEMLEQLGYARVEVIKDLYDKDRMVKACLD